MQNSNYTSDLMSSFRKEQEYNARCKAAINVIKMFVKDAERQLKSSIDIKTLQLVFETLDKEDEGEN